MSTVDAGTRRANRLKLAGLAALFFGPLAAAFVVYYALPWLRPAASAAHGTLISPARPLPDVALVGADGRVQPATLLHKRWSFVWVGPGSCADDCRQALASMRVVHELLDEDSSRVQRVFLYTGAAPAPELLTGEDAAVLAAGVDAAAGQALLAEFPEPAAGRVYIVDPHGNLMMYFAHPGDRKGMLKDITRLLKYSHIG